MKRYTKEEISQLMNEFSLPDNSKFQGYVIHFFEADEFLESIQRIKNTVTQRGFVKTPELAKVFRNYEKALHQKLNYTKQDSNICLLFDTGKQFVIIQDWKYKKWAH